MGIPTATGNLSLPLSKLAAQLAGLTSFQSFTFAADSTEALSRIHIVAAAGDGQFSAPRPFALITWADFSSRVGPYSGGRLLLRFEADVSDAYQGVQWTKDAAYEFLNPVGAILEDLVEVEPGGELLIPRNGGLTWARPPQRSYDCEDGDYWVADFYVNFGLS